jgi:peptidyl-prolyl cis-trans isomerase C
MTRQKRWLPAILIVIWGCFSGYPGPVAAETTEGVLAVVDGSPITVADFLTEVSRRPGGLDTPARKEAMLADMLHLELLYRGATATGYDRDPAIQARIRRLIANQYRADRLEARLSGITVSDREVAAYYRRHTKEFMIEPKVRAAVIRITVPFNASEEKRKELRSRAAAARKEALALKPDVRTFGTVAITYSDHQPTRYRGGDTGWLRAGRPDRRFPEEVLAAVFASKKIGKVGPVMETEAGFFIVKRVAAEPSKPLALDTVAERIRQQLRDRKRAETEQAFYEELKRRFPVQVNRARLGAIDTGSGAGKPPALPGK